MHALAFLSNIDVFIMDLPVNSIINIFCSNWLTKAGGWESWRSWSICRNLDSFIMHRAWVGWKECAGILYLEKESILIHARIIKPSIYAGSAAGNWAHNIHCLNCEAFPKTMCSPMSSRL